MVPVAASPGSEIDSQMSELVSPGALFAVHGIVPVLDNGQACQRSLPPPGTQAQ